MDSTIEAMAWGEKKKKRKKERKKAGLFLFSSQTLKSGENENVYDILTQRKKYHDGHTQKSRLYLRFLKSPPTRAAKWITWVGLYLSNIALVAAASLRNRKFLIYKLWAHHKYSFKADCWLQCYKTNAVI